MPALQNSSEVSTREQDLLACCAHPIWDARLEARARGLIEQGFDWNSFNDLMRRHGLRPLAYRRLRVLPDGLVPKDVLAALQAHFHTNALHNLLLSRSLLVLLGRMERDGLAAIPFKGPLLAARAYGDIALREFGDIDIVVRRRDAWAAMTAIEAKGYRLTKGSRTSLSGYHRRFTNPDGRVVVELHWGLTLKHMPLALDLEELWARRVPADFLGANICAFSREDTMLLLCFHGGRHMWRGLGWVCDIAALLSQDQELDWASLSDRAQKSGCMRALLLGLRLSQELFGTELPAQVRSCILADEKVLGLARLVRERFLWSNETPGVPATYRYHLALRERFRERRAMHAYLLRLLFTPIPEDRELLPLPAGLGFLYYPFRAARLARLWLPRLWKRIPGLNPRRAP